MSEDRWCLVAWKWGKQMDKSDWIGLEFVNIHSSQPRAGFQYRTIAWSNGTWVMPWRVTWTRSKKKYGMVRPSWDPLEGEVSTRAFQTNHSTARAKSLLTPGALGQDIPEGGQTSSLPGFVLAACWNDLVSTEVRPDPLLGLHQQAMETSYCSSVVFASTFYQEKNICCMI